eukprot:scaffold13189_cov103-Isochrysis_galbana.AAC.5
MVWRVSVACPRSQPCGPLRPPTRRAPRRQARLQAEVPWSGRRYCRWGAAVGSCRPTWRPLRIPNDA